jgi:predicted nucleic acid-binding protein
MHDSEGQVVVDTNVVSYRMQESPMGERCRSILAAMHTCLTVVTLEELLFGAERAGWGKQRRERLDALIADHELLPATEETARVSARIRAERERQGRPISRPDAWIAATALCNGLPLVSHDRDVRGISGLRVYTLSDFGVEGSKAPFRTTPMSGRVTGGAVEIHDRAA